MSTKVVVWDHAQPEFGCFLVLFLVSHQLLPLVGSYLLTLWEKVHAKNLTTSNKDFALVAKFLEDKNCFFNISHGNKKAKQ